MIRARYVIIAGLLAAVAIARIEHVTHAARVSLITGAPYLQVLSPLTRITSYPVALDDNAETMEG
jgi:hypothetical protein